MGTISTPLPVLGSQRGDGEAAVRDVLSALLTEFNSNIETSNLKNGGLDAVKLRGATEVLGQSPGVAYVGDVDGAKWLVAFGNFKFVFYSDNADTGAVAGFANLVYAGRTYRAKVALGPDGTVSSSAAKKSIIPATESTGSASFTKLATPDQVTVTLPTDGLIKVLYQAIWQANGGSPHASIFLGTDQLRVFEDDVSSPFALDCLGPAGAADSMLFTTPAFGLHSTPANGYTGEVNTGQMVGAILTTASSGASGGPAPIYIRAAAGTYTISLQFKTATVKNRRLWVAVEAYS